MPLTRLLERKSEIRRQALDRRRDAHASTNPARAAGHLFDLLERRPAGAVVSGYMAIRTEADPMPAMLRLAALGRRLCLPVIQGKGQPLIFREWTPDSAMIEGDFGALIPRGGEIVEPEILITPLVAFDADGNRMGYGGGFYDRTLETLRARGGAMAVGFAFAAQETDCLPREPTDQPLDMIVTENGPRRFR